jgi:transposase
MEINELFRVALGLEAPWQVTKVEFSEADGKLQLWLDFPAGSTFPCPVCAKSGCGAYNTEARTSRHLNFFQHQTLLHARQPASSVRNTASRPWRCLGRAPEAASRC